MGRFDIESDGSSDFSSIFASEAERVRENEERLQAQRFLEILDEMEKSQNTDGLVNHRRGPGLRKEFMRVSITDDDDAINKKEKEKKNNKPDKKVHTIDDLPVDDFDFIFGAPPSVPEPPSLNIEAGRRLKDGAIQYSASFPGIFEHLDVEKFFNIEFFFIVFLTIFIVGFWLGRKLTSGRQQRRVKTQRETRTHEPQTRMQPQIIYITQDAFHKQFPSIQVPMEGTSTTTASTTTASTMKQ
jgi:hypothetical protein